MPNRHAVSHPSADSSVANTQRHTTHPRPFRKRLGLHYTGLFYDPKSDQKCPPRKQSISSKQATHPRPKSTKNIYCEPNAAEAGLTQPSCVKSSELLQSLCLDQLWMLWSPKEAPFFMDVHLGPFAPRT